MARLTLASITLIGFFGSSVLTKTVIVEFERLLERLPFVRLVYTSSKDLLNAFVGEKRRFDKPVLVSLTPDGTIKGLGFITQETLAALGEAERLDPAGLLGELPLRTAGRARDAEAEAAVDLAWALDYFMQMRQSLSECRVVLEAAHAAAEQDRGRVEERAFAVLHLREAADELGVLGDLVALEGDERGDRLLVVAVVGEAVVALGGGLVAVEFEGGGDEGVGHQRDDAVQAEGQAPVRRRAVLQRIEQEAELELRLFGSDLQRVEHFLLHVGAVVLPPELLLKVTVTGSYGW